MKIQAIAHGGFAGQSEHYEIDTSTSRHGRALEAALAGDDFFSAPAGGEAPQGADLQHWTITVDDGARRRSIAFCDDGRPEHRRWQQLLQEIRAAA